MFTDEEDPLYAVTLGRVRGGRERECGRCDGSSLVMDGAGYVELCRVCMERKRSALLLGRYFVIREIQRGTHSATFKARDIYFCVSCRRSPRRGCRNSGHRDVCVKVLRPQSEGTGEKEWRALWMLGGCGGNVCEVMDHFSITVSAKSFLCVVMEFLQPIRARHSDGDFVRRVCADLLGVLCVLHKRKIIHGDIKTENVMQGGGRYKLVDFGLCVLRGKKKPKKIQSRFFRAPEVLRGEDYDEKTDMWSLGCLLFHLATGKYIFKERTDSGMMKQIVSLFGKRPIQAFEVEEKIGQLLGTADSAFVSFVSLLLNPSPEKRVSSQTALCHPFLLFHIDKQIQ
ncbi:MAG: CMGC/DYRK protein kinase [Amphiamblys sp. WSBS2006]|nr:MAG: CMGC/DYRK protein kinase [Amphiamblys sp. WSBS2006]